MNILVNEYNLTNIMDIETLAKHLLLDKKLLINGIEHGIVEIEIYCRCIGHDDPYVHSSKEQLEYGKFYFHRHKNGTFKGGTYKGMDITFGNQDMYFAVLIRSISGPEGIIEGPCKIVNTILDSYEVKSLNDFIDPNSKLDTLSTTKVLDVFNNHRKLHLIDTNIKSSVFKEIYFGPRVGLNPRLSPEWCNVAYRFTTHNKLKRCRASLQSLDVTL